MTKDDSREHHHVIIDPFIIVASSAGATCSRLICYPLDTLRVRRQFTTAASNTSLWSHLRPFTKLYSGLSISLLFGVPAVSSYLTTYTGVKQFLASDSNVFLPKDGIGAYAVAGLAAELVSEIVFTPMEVVKSRMQVGQGTTGVFGVFRDVLQESGIRGLFKGYTLGLGVYLPYTIMYWSVYEKAKLGLAKVPTSLTVQGQGSNTTVDYLLASAIACGTAASLSNVIDIVKTRYQIASGIKSAARSTAVNTLKSAAQAQSVREIVIDLYRENGWKAFTRGMGLRAAAMVPSNMVSMTVFEKIKENKASLWPLW